LRLDLASVALSGRRVIYAIGHEITDLKDSDLLLKERERALRGALDIVPIAAMIATRGGAVEYLSRGFVKTLGYVPGDFLTMDRWWQEAVPDSVHRETLRNAWLTAAGKADLAEEQDQALIGRVKTKGGSVLDVEFRIRSAYDRVAMLISETGERKRVLIPPTGTNNIESVETLAGGIAHDFNNLLLVILGNISLAKTGLPVEDKAYGHLLEAEQASMMTKDLIQQLITFSKGGELSKRVMLITPLIMDVTRTILGGSNVKGRYIMSDDLLSVEVDEGQIKQVMHIILRNAREAMFLGGTVTISFENAKVARGDYLPLAPGDYVLISIRDEGAGIKEEHLPRIFDPYFTTKEMGSRKGVGLGLAIAYSIVKKHNGHIAVESRIGGGTIFHIYLPAAGKGPPVGKETEVSAELQKSKGKILVMDDAKAVRDVTGAMLSYLGYEVAFARDGREAIAIYREARESGEPFDVVILDLTVQGGIGGKEAVQVLLTLDPDLKAIISSGYSGDPIMTEFHEYGFKLAILKPYKMDELAEILERLIRGSE
jgi:signal transduction histidine kinase/CheY-like chemotaxis protein